MRSANNTSRDSEIAAAYRSGESLRCIGRRYRISKQRVHQILVRRTDVILRPKGASRPPTLAPTA